MFVYSGIDEAGYGPLLGPLVIAETTVVLPSVEGKGASEAGAGKSFVDLWKELGLSVTKKSGRNERRLVVNDSKKVYNPSTGIRQLERSVLSFASVLESGDLDGDTRAKVSLTKTGFPPDLYQWLTFLGETSHFDLSAMPWYCDAQELPWESLPAKADAAELSIARHVLKLNLEQRNILLADMAGAVVFEDRFNHMVSATRSKAATSFTFVGGHLLRVWQRWGRHHPLVVVDRQSGRSHYRPLLQQIFPSAKLTVLEETDSQSAYFIHESPAERQDSGAGMTVRFEVEADDRHFPVALASMTAKYTREMLMMRFNRWFGARIPNLTPTAGYATDGKRFWRDIQPHLRTLNIDSQTILRQR